MRRITYVDRHTAYEEPCRFFRIPDPAISCLKSGTLIIMARRTAIGSALRVGAEMS
jgi:hypothetical protein